MATAMASSALRNLRARAPTESFEGRPVKSGAAQRFDEYDADGRDGNGAQRRGALPESLSAAHRRVLDLLRAWDRDADRSVSREEFRQAVAALGFVAPAEDVDAVFDAMDEDGSGQLSFAELSASLRPSTIARNKHALRRGKLGPNARKSALGSGVTVSATATESVQQQLQRILLRSRARVMDLLREWDDDGSGTVTASEFHGALAALGYEAERPDVEALFELFDFDGSGKIDYGELHAALRDGAAALDAVDPATGESKRRKAPLRRTPTFGSRPSAGGTCIQTTRRSSRPPPTERNQRRSQLGARSSTS